MVIQFDSGVVAVGRGTLIVQRPPAAQCKAVGCQTGRVVKHGRPFVICAAAAVVDHLADSEVRLGSKCGPRGKVGRGGAAGLGEFDAGLGIVEQLPDQRLGDVVIAFSELDVPHRPGSVDQILGGPIAIPVVGPSGVVVVERNRIADAQIGRAFGDVARDLLESVLGGVHADDRQTTVFVGLIPTDDVGDGPLAVNAGVGPKVNQHHLATQ
ncbi:Uncharacterised protein [Mycobacterium tuberculosis]|uniref:Uncharacterized protein n=1 Tax=Mycobacterium tuberculosis TaxID=1773 RepID=A0A654TIK7_MYCTX|nr:Uncharacterised protein [Mycobacterium tuberculosis]CFE47121.1 Uncharacterised protein [Mycobacterium tuberculosis]CFR73104.1 Uncharacterised protein [Mycobacterium tuberculosis]CFR93423.1 Uncharacterised protein [Mycobacterium tuberculosis]CKT40829.1 Uncharacterised protein [Mycobacterium tuberculosis]